MLSWKLRFFGQVNEKLCYFKQQRDPHPLGSIDIRNILKVEKIVESGNSGQNALVYSFDVHMSSGRVYHLKTEEESEESSEYWVSGLKGWREHFLENQTKQVALKSEKERSLTSSPRSKVIASRTTTVSSLKKSTLPFVAAFAPSSSSQKVTSRAEINEKYGELEPSRFTFILQAHKIAGNLQGYLLKKGDKGIVKSFKKVNPLIYYFFSFLVISFTSFVSFHFFLFMSFLSFFF